MSLQTELQVESLHIYPVKSCGGITLDSATIGPRGLETEGVRDRSWLIVDEAGDFVSQRKQPKLATVRFAMRGGGVIEASATGAGSIRLDPLAVGDRYADGKIFHKPVTGHCAAPQASAWFSAFLGQPVTLLHQTPDDIRLYNPRYSSTVGAVGYADQFPYLVATPSMLARVNATLAAGGYAPVPMNRFRPNIVIGAVDSDKSGYEDYAMKTVALGDANLNLVKPCTRCKVTTVDQATGVIPDATQPLAALNKTAFLNLGTLFPEVKEVGVVFGELAVATRCGPVTMGDPVTVVEAKRPYAFGHKPTETAASL